MDGMPHVFPRLPSFDVRVVDDHAPAFVQEGLGPGWMREGVREGEREGGEMTG
jgi:hypothetical protein